MSTSEPAHWADEVDHVSETEYSDNSDTSDDSDDSDEQHLGGDPRDDVQAWIDKADYIPKGIGYDWRPFCAALIDNHRDARGVFRPPRPTLPSSLAGAAGGGGGNSGHVFFGDDPGELAPMKGGDWDHIRYVPAWMDPDYRDELIETPRRKLRYNSSSTRDAMYNLRPALRLADAIRNPTDYALRYGMAAGRLDGRSRMSPTWSKTRDPIDDFNNQINQLSDAERRRAVELSRQRYQQRKQVPIPGQEVLPEVVELMLSQGGLLTNAELVAELEKAASTGMSLDQMVYGLGKKNPQIKKAHQVFIDNAQDDQDYQRVLLAGLTTDELIQHNVHTMSDEFVMELDNPIHPLFDRNRWDNCDWRGRRAQWPRNVYNVNGTREEYNVASNDAIWEALQPALRLSSMVLSQNPPIFEALMNMTTRQPIPERFDCRTENLKNSPTMYKYVLEKSIDMSKTHPTLRLLGEIYAYDWRSNVLRVLSDALVLDLDWGFSLANQILDERIDEDTHNSFGFGSTQHDRTKGKIRIRLAAELVWPLLVPQYSASEKMTCSFLIATTLLHELAHAICQAQEILLRNVWAHPAGQNPEVTRLILSLEQEFRTSWGQEPFFENSPKDEVGNDLEGSLWGNITNIVGADRSYPRHYLGLGFALGVETYPDESEGLRADAPMPVVQYLRPIPLPYVAKLFKKSFWQLEFAAYGFAALKIRPDGMPQLNVLRGPRRADGFVVLDLYGLELTRFLAAVPMILLQSRQHALGAYLDALQIEIVYRHQWAQWWTQEIKNWREHLIHPLKRSMGRLAAELDRADELHRQRFAVDQTPYYEAWRNAQQNSAAHNSSSSSSSSSSQSSSSPSSSSSFPAWKRSVEQAWEATFRYGGWLMQRLLIAYNDMQDDIGALSRMVFYFLSVRPSGVHYNLDLHNAGAAAGAQPEQSIVRIIYRRLLSFRQYAHAVAKWVGDISRIPQLAAGADKWEQWRARFGASVQQYEELISMLAEGVEDDEFEFDVVRKARFRRLPTADWKHASERFKKMALRDYTRADVAVRDTIDEFLVQFKRLDPISSQAGTMVDDIESAMRYLDDIDRRPDRATIGSIFDFVAPPTAQSQAQAEPPAAAATQPPPGPSPSSRSGKGAIVVGSGSAARRRSSLGDSPPRRIMGPRRPDASRVRKPTIASDARHKGRGYQRYITNLLTTPDPGTTASKTLRELLQATTPSSQAILGDLLPARKQLAPGNGGFSVAPFPNPFAGRTVMTSEAVAFQQQKELATKAARARGEASGVYVADSLWREKHHSDDSDDDEGDGLRNKNKNNNNTQ
ncbi:hypothetical protein F5Y14DRAFT_22427 [Nemania sp. NC0429]|nr:hypothetical protein F5Y14DRAFT_22427 [Nemania sp. NC0429]